jgi:hypothetical protein
MTKEEYDEAKANLTSDDQFLKIQALLVVGMFPEWGSENRYTMHEVESKLRALVGGNCSG